MIDLNIDKYAKIDSPIHHWNTQFKMIGLFVLIFSFSFVQTLILAPVLIIVTAIIFLLSKLPFKYLLNRLSYPGIFLLATGVFLPLFSGNTILFQIGQISIKLEGLLMMILIIVKFICILTLGVVLFGTSSFLTTIKSLRSLHLSPILVDMILLTYRYIFDVGNDFRIMVIAMQLRFFQLNRLSFRNLSTVAALSGTLLIRSFEKSERIYKAMILRGYGYESNIHVRKFVNLPTKTDKLGLYAILIISIVIIMIEIYLRQNII